MATTKRGQGLVISAHREFELARSQTGSVRPAGPVKSQGMIFPRGDTPFTGEGQQVSLTAEPGYTKRGWLTVPFRFQLPPHEPIQRTAAHTWSNFDVLDPDDVGAERTRSGGSRLRTVSVSTMFMDWSPTYAVWQPQLLDPVLAARELEHVCLKGIRFRFKIRNRGLFDHDDVNMIAVITQCAITEQTGEPETRYVALEFQEYIATEVERKAVKNEVGPWSHKIKNGDTLYKLSERYYKRRSGWQDIARANKWMDNQPPSANLDPWAKTNKRRTITIPQNSRAGVPVAA